jgi:hypothetical protein
MATTKTAGNKAAAKANEFALKGFPSAKLKTAFNKMAGAANEADGANEQKALAAFDVCELAERFRDSNMVEGADCETIAKGWSEHLKSVAMDLAVSGNKFAELKEGKEGEAATARLTAYGANVASVAKGLIQEMVLLDCLPACDGIEEGTAAESYRDVRKVVEAKRAERRRNENPDAALLADSKAECREAAAALLDTVFESGDYNLIDSLAEALRDMRAATIAQNQAQDEADDEVAEAA